MEFSKSGNFSKKGNNFEEARFLIDHGSIVIITKAVFTLKYVR